MLADDNTLRDLIALEANLKSFEIRLVDLREQIRNSQGFSGDIADLATFKDCRKRYRLMKQLGDSILRRAHNKAVS